MASPLEQRSSGVLTHPTSLPGPFPQGDIGPAARQFVDFLNDAGQRWWQMLPIHPTGGCDSPYDSPSAFAGSQSLISIEDLVEVGLLDWADLADVPALQDEERADFAATKLIKGPLLEKAYATFQRGVRADISTAYEQFLRDNNAWVWDYALFMVLKEENGGRSWVQWDEALRTRVHGALERAHSQHHNRVGFYVFAQFIFHYQWDVLRKYASHRGVLLMGDVPMFVSHDSTDVWANQSMFFLDERGERTVQAGVPPDYFSEDGQLWGNPLYRWDRMKDSGFGWWLDRLRRELSKFDAVRIDHFIAIKRYWEVPVPASTAKEGRYVDAPGYEFFEAARAAFGGLPFVAEDLGILTEEVERLRDHFELPGMKVIQFGFFEGAEAYLPHRYQKTAVAYLGTHDNDTTRGWFESLRQQSISGSDNAHSARAQLKRLAAYMGVESATEVNRQLIRSLFASPANTVVITVQDILNQSSRYRMNVPGTAEGNWTYRFKAGALTQAIADELRSITEATERIVR